MCMPSHTLTWESFVPESNIASLLELRDFSLKNIGQHPVAIVLIIVTTWIIFWGIIILLFERRLKEYFAEEQ